MNIQNLPIEIDPHGLNGADNSYYLPGPNRIAFGDGGVDDAEDVDVILHEYGHAIQFGQVPGWGGGEEGAMGEGFGDYWAGSFSISISEFRWYWVFNWDGHNPFWSGRILNSTKHYPEDMTGQIHTDGEIWSAGLMDCLRDAGVGRAVMDNLVLEHHFMIGSSATMAEAAAAIIDADINLFDGAHVGPLLFWLSERGFLDPEDFSVLLIAGFGLGAPGSSENPLDISAVNPFEMGYVGFTLVDLPDFLTGVDVQPAARAAGLELSFFDEKGTLSITLDGGGTEVVPPGSGPILIIFYDVVEEAAPGELIELSFADILVLDGQGTELPVSSVSGTFVVGQPCDVVPDGEVNILDIIRTMQIALEAGEPPTEYELWAADADENGVINIFDIILCIQEALGGGVAKAAGDGGAY